VSRQITAPPLLISVGQKPAARCRRQAPYRGSPTPSASATAASRLNCVQKYRRSAIYHPDYPIKGFVEYFLYFVAAPIILVWIVATRLERKEQGA